jgi:anti-sigma B factor antagonist
MLPGQVLASLAPEEGGLMTSVEKRAPVGGHPVVALAGDLDFAGAAAAAAEVEVAVGITAGQRLIIDLAALEFVDCSGVRALLSVQELARQAGGDVLLAVLQTPVLRLVTLLRLADVLGAHASVAAAAVSAGPARCAASWPAVSTAHPGKPAAPGTG